MARKQLDVYQRHKAEKRQSRRDLLPPKVFDRRDLSPPVGVVAMEDVVRGPLDAHNERSRVTRNIRGDILGGLYARQQIDQHQFQAGREWQRHWEAAEIGGMKAMDTTKEPVDGGGLIVEPLTDKQRLAVKRLACADADLGLEGRYLLIDVLGKGLSIEVAASLRGAMSMPERKFWGKRLRECLDTLAVTYGYADRRLTGPANHL